MAAESQNNKIKVLFAAFEAAPFFKTGGLGDVAGSLPGAMLAAVRADKSDKNGAEDKSNAEVEVRVILPKFAALDEWLEKNRELCPAGLAHVVDFRVPLAWRWQYCGIEELEYNGVVYYFVDNEYYFKRERLYGYGDDAERIAYFAKAVVEAMQYLPGFFPDILHCNDWHTALSPVFLREQYREAPGYDRVRTVFSVHNLKFQGVFGPEVLGDVLGLHECRAAREQLLVRKSNNRENNNKESNSGNECVNYMRGAVCYSDRLLTVSPAYADEICTPDCGEGLESIFARRRSRLGGILNGINTVEYDPASDKYIPAVFSGGENGDMTGKECCKRELQRSLGLEVRQEVPLAVLVSRLTEQKGIDLLLHILAELLAEDIQVAVLGVGEERYEQAFRWFAGEYPGKFACELTFDDALAHRFYAGADMLLMPSRFEPCGLSQMIAMRYGALPIVRATGGLKDSVVPYDEVSGRGNGFSFADYNAHQLLFTIKDALALWRQPEKWQQVRMQAMQTNNSWRRSADEYLAVYRELYNEI